MKRKLVNLFKSEKFKKAILVLGGLFYALTIIIVFNPDPFIKYGYFGVFVFNIFGPGTILVPTLSRYMNVIGVSVVGALGMALNDSVGWMVGRSGDVVIPRSKGVKKLEKKLHKWGSWMLFLLALIPFPYDIVAIIAGYLEFSYRSFVIPVFLARTIRFMLLGFGVVAVWGRVVN